MLNKGPVKTMTLNSDFKAIGYSLIGMMVLVSGWAVYTVYG